MFALLLFLDNDSSSTSPWVVVLGLCLTAGVIGILSLGARRQTRFIEGWLSQQGFGPRDALPKSLRRPVSAWQSAPETRSHFAARRNDLDFAYFEIKIQKGEEVTWRVAVAAHANAARVPLFPGVMARDATVDAHSVPGWIVASMPRSGVRASDLDSLLSAVTVSSDFAGEEAAE